MPERTTRMQLWKDMDGNLTEKKSELAGTYDMPLSPSDKRKNGKPGGEKAVIDKTAGVKDKLMMLLRGGRPAPDPAAAYEEFVHGIAGKEGLSPEEVKANLAAQDAMDAKGWPKQAHGLTEDNILKQAFGSDNKPQDNEDEPITDENITKQPQPKTLKPTVDVTSQEPPKLVTQKTAQRYALPSQGKYPLDGYDQVKTASAYFDEWHMRMTPEMRREYCQNMVKRAHELAIPVSPLAECYGSDKYATAGQIKQAMDARRMVLHGAMDPLHEPVEENYDLEVLNKLAEAQPGMLPDTFVAVLGQFDRAVGLDHHYGGDIPDPYFSTFSKEAAKQESKTDPDASIIVGNEYLTVRDLVKFSKLHATTMKDRFGDELAGEFMKDPKSIFDSLPRDQKLVIMRMANFINPETVSSAS